MVGWKKQIDLNFVVAVVVVVVAVVIVIVIVEVVELVEIVHFDLRNIEVKKFALSLWKKIVH